jgi:hypothetical protein
MKKNFAVRLRSGLVYTNVSSMRTEVRYSKFLKRKTTYFLVTLVISDSPHEVIFSPSDIEYITTN